MVAPFRCAHTERKSGLFAVGGALRCQCAGGIDCVADNWRPGPDWEGHCFWSGTFVCQRRCEACTTTQPNPPECGSCSSGVVRWCEARLTVRCLLLRWSFRLRRLVTNVRGAVTLPARPCGAPRFASRSSISGRMHHPFPRDFQWMSARTCQQRLRGWPGGAQRLGWKLRQRQEGHTKRLVGFFRELGSRHSFRSGGMLCGQLWRREAWSCGETSKAQSSDCVVSLRNGLGRHAGDGRLGATRSAVRKLNGRRKRTFRPPAPILGDDGKPLTSLTLQPNTKQPQRELMKEFKVRADKQAAPHRAADGRARIAEHGACGRMLFTFSPSPSQVVPRFPRS